MILRTFISIYITVFSFSAVAKTWQCAELFQSKELLPHLNQRKRILPPPKQCLGTCYLEASVLALNYLVRENFGSDFSVSRTEAIKYIVLERLSRAFLNIDGLRLPARYKYTKQKDHNREIVDLISGGSADYTLITLKNKKIITEKRLTFAQQREENQIIDQTLNELNYKVREIINWDHGQQKNSRIFFEYVMDQLAKDFNNEWLVEPLLSIKENWSQSYFERSISGLKDLLAHQIFRLEKTIKENEQIIEQLKTSTRKDLKVIEIILNNNAGIKKSREQLKKTLNMVAIEQEKHRKHLQAKVTALKRWLSRKLKVENTELFEFEGFGAKQIHHRFDTKKSINSLINKMQMFLAEGQPLMIRYFHDHKLMRQMGEFKVLHPEPTTGTMRYANHLALLVGFERNEFGEVTHFIIQQSWGYRTGAKGLMRMSVSYFDKYVDEVYTLYLENQNDVNVYSEN